MDKKYTTKEIDYTGCHPVIAESLINCRSIMCGYMEVDDREFEVIAYDITREFPYRAAGKDVGLRGTVVPIKKKQPVLKKASELVLWFEENGWIPGHSGWVNDGRIFTYGMLRVCGEPISLDEGRCEGLWIEDPDSVDVFILREWLVDPDDK